MLVWKCKEFFNGLFGEYPESNITDFLNTLPEERALEAKIIIQNTFGWVYYRENENY